LIVSPSLPRISETVKVPDRAVSRGILEPGMPVYWSYEKVVGVGIVSDGDLKTTRTTRR